MVMSCRRVAEAEEEPAVEVAGNRRTRPSGRMHRVTGEVDNPEGCTRWTECTSEVRQRL